MPHTTASKIRGIGTTPVNRRAARALATHFRRGMRVALTTHVNADGDGVGSEVALWHLLRAQGLRPFIANPTPLPERFSFLLRGARGADRSDRAVAAIRRADAIAVLDISDLSRLGHLAPHVESAGVPTMCIDHHASAGTLPPGPRLVDRAAAATGELIFDLAVANGWAITTSIARAIYVALLTDTGGFRFANTTARVLKVAGSLLERGVNPEEIYGMVYANYPEGRVRILVEALDTLVVEPDSGIAWVTVPPGAIERHAATADDLDGIVEYARSIRGIKLALLFRELANGRVKVSFRSLGRVDVARLAKAFGGGGHTKAAGASVVGSLDEAQRLVLDHARRFVTNGG